MSWVHRPASPRSQAGHPRRGVWVASRSTSSSSFVRLARLRLTLEARSQRRFPRPGRTYESEIDVAGERDLRGHPRVRQRTRRWSAGRAWRDGHPSPAWLQLRAGRRTRRERLLPSELHDGGHAEWPRDGHRSGSSTIRFLARCGLRKIGAVLILRADGHGTHRGNAQRERASHVPLLRPLAGGLRGNRSRTPDALGWRDRPSCGSSAPVAEQGASGGVSFTRFTRTTVTARSRHRSGAVHRGTRRRGYLRCR